MHRHLDSIVNNSLWIQEKSNLVTCRMKSKNMLVWNDHHRSFCFSNLSRWTTRSNTSSWCILYQWVPSSFAPSCFSSDRWSKLFPFLSTSTQLRISVDWRQTDLFISSLMNRSNRQVSQRSKVETMLYHAVVVCLKSDRCYVNGIDSLIERSIPSGDRMVTACVTIPQTDGAGTFSKNVLENRFL